MPVKQWPLLLVVLLAAGSTLPACGSPTPKVIEKPVVQTRVVERPVVQTQVVERTRIVEVTAVPPPGPKTIRLHLGPEDVPTLDPSLAADIASVQIVEETTVGLTRLDDSTTATEPGMATRWDISADGRVYTFTLRADVPWVRYDAARNAVVKVQGCPDQDGKTRDRLVTAGDFAYAFLRTLRPDTASPNAYVLGFAVKGAADYNMKVSTDPRQVGIKALDEYHLQITFLEPAAYNAGIAGMPLGHAEPSWLIGGDLCTEPRGERWTETGFFQGYGPYVLKEWIHNTSVTLVKNPFWPGTPQVPAPRIEQIVWSLLDDEQAFAAYQAGGLDATAVPPSAFERARADPVLSREMTIAPSLQTYYFGFNTRAPVVADVRVRRALSMAIDRQQLIRDVARGNQQPAQWFCRPGLTACPTPAEYPDLGVKYDPGQARAILEGYLQEKGIAADRLDLTLLYNRNTGNQNLAEAVRQMWLANLGVNVKLAQQEWQIYLETVFNPRSTTQIWRLGWTPDYPDANNFDLEVAAFGGGANPATGGGLNWKNESYEQLVRAAARETDVARRTALYAQAEQILVWEDAVMAPIYWYTRTVATRPYVSRTWPTTGIEHVEKWDLTL